VLEELQAAARSQDLTLSQAIAAVLTSESLPSRSQKALDNFVKMLQGWRNFAQAHPFPLLAAEVVAQTQLEKRCEEEEKGDKQRAESKVGNIRNLLAEIERFSLDNPERTLNDFLEEVALVTDADQYDETQEGVNLMTLHSAKGLEFPVVFIGGLEEGLLPLLPYNGGKADIEEERRLFYVGVTRAKERLVLGFADNRLRWGNYQWSGPSRFLGDIPSELFGKKKARRTKSTDGLPAAAAPGMRKSARDETETTAAEPSRHEIEPDELAKGLLVKHRKFGLGVIADIKGRGWDSRLVVDFDEVGEKTLILRYARLERV